MNSEHLQSTSELVTRQQVETRVNDIFKNPAVETKVVDLLIKNRPVTYSKQSNSPYYNEFYAKKAKEILDQVAREQKPLVLQYKTYCEGPHKIAKNTLYLKLNSAIRYLLENMDTPDKYYFKLRQCVDIERRPGYGVVITPKDMSVEDMTPVLLVPKKEYPKWKQRMEDWIDNSEVGDAPFVQRGLQLTFQEIKEIKSSLLGIDNIMASITAFEIKLIKINPPTNANTNQHTTNQ